MLWSFKVSSNLEAIAREYERLKALDPSELNKPSPPAPLRLSDGLTAQARAVIEALDERGRWVEDGRLRYHGPDDPTRRVLECQTFIKNVSILSAYLKASKP